MKKHNLTKYCSVFAAIVLALATVATSFADSANSSIISPDSVAYGRTFAEWQTAWGQWALSIPVGENGENHPLFEGTDPSVGQAGPVFFLGGKFCPYDPSGERGCEFEGVVRTITVPEGKALFFPVLNYGNSALEEEQLYENENATINYLRTDAQGTIDFVISNGVLTLEIDGKSVKDLETKHRGQSTVFGVTIPEDNVWKAIYNPDNPDYTGPVEFPAGTYWPAVDEGFYVMLKPWPANGQQHVIHFRADIPDVFVLDVTYYITVEQE